MRPALALPIAALLAAASAHAADVQRVLAPLRTQIEESDFRATGQLVAVEASGKRISYPISVKGLWYAGAMHTLLDVNDPGDTGAPARKEGHIRILLEVRPDGRDSIRIYRPNQSRPTDLPFDRWSESPWGDTFSYEDLLEPQYFWAGQTILRSTLFGARHCDVLKSTPGPSDHTDYSEVQTWLDQAIDYPVYAEKTMKQGGAVKEFTYYGLRQTSGVWSATQVEARIRGRAGSTFLIIKRGSAKAHLSANDFRPEQISHFEGQP